jgi:hypothetical protein
MPLGKQRNRLISKMRYIVERAFGTVKKGHGATRASSPGVVKVKLGMTNRGARWVIAATVHVEYHNSPDS